MTKYVLRNKRSHFRDTVHDTPEEAGAESKRQFREYGLEG